MDTPFDSTLILDGLRDAVVAADVRGVVTYANRACEALFGLTQQQLVGRPLTSLMPERFHAAHEVGFARYFRTRESRIIGKPVQVAALRADGEEIEVELTLSVFVVDGQDLVVAALRDQRERLELEREIQVHSRLRLQFDVMEALARGGTSGELIDRVVEVIAGAMDREVGLYWGVDPGRDLLVVRSALASTPDGHAFVDASRAARLSPGIGLVGEVWSSGSVRWSNTISEDTSYVRSAAARDAGLTSSLVFPVASERRMFGVLEFLGPHGEGFDAELVETMRSVGFQIGQSLERVEQAARLAASEHWLDTVLRSIGDAIVATDSEGRVVFANPVAQRLTGWSEDDARGRPLDDVFHIIDEDSREPRESPVARVMRERRTVALANHTLLTARDGTERVIEDSAAPITSPDEGLGGVVLCFRDATEKAHARREVERARQMTTLVSEAMPNIVWTCDAQGRATYFNQAWYDYTGLTRDGDLVGERELRRTVVHPDDRGQVDALWDHALRSTEPYRAEMRLRRGADASWRWHLAQATPLRDENGELLGWVGSSTDIHLHKRTEFNARFLADASSTLTSSLELADTLDGLAHLVVPRFADWCAIYLRDEAGAPEMVCVVHRDPAMVALARELIERYPPDESASAGAAHVMVTGQAELFPEISDSVLESVAVDAEHRELLRKLGMRSGATLPLSARGHVLGAISLVTAESNRRLDELDFEVAQELAARAAHAIDNAQLYEEVRAAVRVRDEFLSLASHELKTPLTPLQLHIQALQRAARRSEDERFVGRLDTLQRQVNRLEMLVDSFLDISRIAADRLALECESVELVELVGEVVDTYAHQAEQAGCRVELEAPDTGMTGTWDRHRLELVLNNLVSNALKFGAGGRVRIRVRGLTDRVELTVADEGVGIELADQARIFERFERAVSPRHYGGFGLGLWIARQMVESLGGTIRVDSRPGHGARFIVELPPDACAKERRD